MSTSVPTKHRESREVSALHVALAAGVRFDVFVAH